MAHLPAWWYALFAGSHADTLLTIALMTVVTVVARSFFFLSDREWALPSWMQRGLQYAPIAALAAVVIPEVVMTKGVFIHTLLDARLYGALAGCAYFLWSRGASHAVLGTIVCGMAIYLPLHIGLGW